LDDFSARSGVHAKDLRTNALRDAPIRQLTDLGWRGEGFDKTVDWIVFGAKDIDAGEFW
jgi:hypothetical protein